MAVACLLVSRVPGRCSLTWSARWARVLPALLLTMALGCNRRPREVTCDLTLRNASGGGESTVLAEPAELYIPEGTQVHILVHNQTEQAHNFVLIQPGHIEDVLAAPSPPSVDSKDSPVLAQGSWVAPHSTQGTRFAAPSAGHYEFTCSCGTASHRGPLRGKLVVQ